MILTLRGAFFVRCSVLAIGLFVKPRAAVLESRNQRLKPDVVVLDFAMPDMKGIETAKQMSASDPNIPIVLFTILEIAGLERPAQDAGIRAIVTKSEAWNLIGSIESLVSQKNLHAH